MRKEEAKKIIEALLFVHEHPLTVDNIVKIMGNEVGKKVIKDAVTELLEEYQGMGRSFHLMEVDGGYQFRTKTPYARWIKNLRKVKPARLSQSALETLAIVVYRQPIVRAEVEHIRGVDSGWVLNSLLEKGLIKILGRKEVAGRPLVYGSSRRFLEVFGLRDLSALPTLQELDALREKAELMPPAEEPAQADE